MKGRFAAMFEALGVDASRLDLLPLIPQTNDHLARWRWRDAYYWPTVLRNLWRE